jgi:hypothetical protein
MLLLEPAIYCLAAPPCGRLRQVHEIDTYDRYGVPPAKFNKGEMGRVSDGRRQSQQ